MKQVPKATIKRYPIYLKALRKIKSEGKDSIMSNELAEYVDIKSTTIRRDFSLLGTLGKQGFGYNVDSLIKIFDENLGVTFNEKIILVGTGNLGKALLNYNHWSDVVGEIVCAFDKNPENASGLSVPCYNINEIKDKIPKDCRIAILCITGDYENTVNLLKEAGITGIVDFTHEHYTVPEGMKIKSVDVVSMIQELVYESNSSIWEDK